MFNTLKQLRVEYKNTAIGRHHEMIALYLYYMRVHVDVRTDVRVRVCCARGFGGDI